MVGVALLVLLLIHHHHRILLVLKGYTSLRIPKTSQRNPTETNAISLAFHAEYLMIIICTERFYTLQGGSIITQITQLNERFYILIFCETMISIISNTYSVANLSYNVVIHKDLVVFIEVTLYFINFIIKIITLNFQYLSNISLIRNIINRHNRAILCVPARDGKLATFNWVRRSNPFVFSVANGLDKHGTLPDKI